MKAISRSKYENLQGSIEELQHLLAIHYHKNSYEELNTELTKKKEDIGKLFKKYLSLLKQLEDITDNYDELMIEIKSNLLSKHLKELKTTIHPASPEYVHLYASVQLLHGT